MTNLEAQIFTNPQKTEVVLTRPKSAGINTGKKTTISTTTNGKSI